MELHSHEASKHASLVHARFLDTARYCLPLPAAAGNGTGTSWLSVSRTCRRLCLDPWYSLLRDRRATRLDFLNRLSRHSTSILQLQNAACRKSCRALHADNLATLDYKTMEELFIVIGELRSILAVSGMQVLYMIQPHVPHQDALMAHHRPHHRKMG